MKLEICAGTIQDCIVAQEIRADRIELNCGLYLGGLTPSLGLFLEARKYTTVPIICMVRPRAAGFCYDVEEVQVMMRDAQLFLEHGAAGIAFGFLRSDGTIDRMLTKQMVQLCRRYDAEAVFHRAFDVTPNPFAAVEQLISCGVTRILTSGQAFSVEQGITRLQKLHQRFGKQIEFCMGAGVNEENIRTLVAQTGITQVHGTFKKWENDPTTSEKEVDYSYGSVRQSYEVVDLERAHQARQSIPHIEHG